MLEILNRNSAHEKSVDLIGIEIAGVHYQIINVAIVISAIVIVSANARVAGCQISKR